ncbi:MAG: glycosyltransferase [Desulfatibacillaceae bacterium]
MQAPELSIVVPMYNESRCIAENAALILQFLDSAPVSSELVLVNDGSTDDTLSISRGIAHSDGRVRVMDGGMNRGKGHAVRTGMLAAEGELRLFMDADLAVPLEFVHSALDRLRGGADVAIASRHMPGAEMKVREESIREVCGKAYRKGVLAAFRLGVTDITCGLKGFQAGAAREVFERSMIPGWGYDAEIIFLARKLGLRIEEFPVHWFHSFDTKVRLVRDSLRTFREMVQIEVHYRRGGYRLK